MCDRAGLKGAWRKRVLQSDTATDKSWTDGFGAVPACFFRIEEDDAVGDAAAINAAPAPARVEDAAAHEAR